MIRNKSASRGIKCVFLLFTMIWCSVSMPLNSCGQEIKGGLKHPDSLDQVNQLNEVRIRKLKISRRQSSSTPLQILSGTDLEKLNSLSVADALRFFSGVQLKDYGGIGGLKTINVRSMGTNHTAVFYDGVQLGNAQNGQVDLGKFSLDNIEEIELYNGQKSTIFQPAKGFASGSSLYLKSKQPQFETGQTQKIRTAVKVGSFGLIDPSLLWQSKLSDRISSSVSAAYKYADGRYKFRSTNGVYDTTAVREDGDFESMRLELGLHGLLADSSKWNLKLYGYADEQGIPGAVVNNVWRFSQRLWNKNFFGQAYYEKEIGPYSLMAAVKYSNNYRRYLNPEVVTTTGFQDNRYHEQELYLSLSNKLRINAYWDLVLSSDYQLNDLNANLYRFAYPTRNTWLTAIATQFHWERLELQANLLGTVVKEKVQNGAVLKDQNELSPTVMVSWQPFAFNEFRLRSFYKSIFRMPTFDDLYYTFYGTRLIAPEYTRQYDLGFTYIIGYENQLLSQFSVQSDVYLNQVKNKIISIPGSLGIWSVVNLGRVEIKGIDVNVQTNWQLGQKLSLNTGLNYTYQTAVDADPSSMNYGDQVPYIPWHNLSFITSATYQRFSFNYSYIYTGERYNQSTNNIYNYVRPWYTHDVAFHYQTKLYKRDAKLSLEVNNLFNQAYEVVSNYPMPGRYYRCSFTYFIN